MLVPIVSGSTAGLAVVIDTTVVSGTDELLAEVGAALGVPGFVTNSVMGGAAVVVVVTGRSGTTVTLDSVTMSSGIWSVTSGTTSVTASSSRPTVVTSINSSVEDGMSVSATTGSTASSTSGSTSGSNEVDGKSVTGSRVVNSSCWSPCGVSVAVDSSGIDADELPTAVNSAEWIKAGCTLISANGADDTTVVLGEAVVVVVVVLISAVVVGAGSVEVETVVSTTLVVPLVVIAGVVMVVLVVVGSATGEDGKSVPMGCCELDACNVVSAASVVGTDRFAKRVDSGVEAKMSANDGPLVDAMVSGADEVSVTANVGIAAVDVVEVNSFKTFGCCDVTDMRRVVKGEAGANGDDVEKPISLAPLKASVVVVEWKGTASEGAQHEPK